VGQDYATKEIHHRVHQRIIEKHGKSCALTAQANTQFHYKPLLSIGDYCFFENKPDALPVAIEDKRQ